MEVNKVFGSIVDARRDSADIIKAEFVGFAFEFSLSSGLQPRYHVICSRRPPCRMNDVVSLLLDR